MDIKQKYREEFNKEPYNRTKAGAYVKSGSYSDDYVRWLEEQLALCNVSNRRELLEGFTEKCNRYRTTVEEITPEEIDKFLDNL